MSDSQSYYRASVERLGLISVKGRYSREEMTNVTTVHSEDIGLRGADRGLHYWINHQQFILPESYTLEGTESYSKTELDGYTEILGYVANEAYDNSDVVRTSPHNSTIHRIDASRLDDPSVGSDMESLSVEGIW